MKPQLTVPHWLSLSKDIRAKLVQQFRINRSRFTIVENNVVKSDGYTHEDLAVINIENLQQYTNSEETDFFKLLDHTIALLEGRSFGVLPQEEVDTFRKEYEARTGKQAPVLEDEVINNLSPQNATNLNEEKNNKESSEATTGSEDKGTAPSGTKTKGGNKASKKQG